MRQKLLASLVIGVIAGLIDITPGMIRGVDFHITLAGFFFWVLNGPVIAFISLPTMDWIKGLVVASFLAVPGMILISMIAPESVVPMLIITVFLGSLVGYLTGIYAR